MLVKAVIAQFLIAVILVKVPAGRYVVSKVSDAVTSVINCGQDGLSFVFGSLADSTAAAGSVFAIQVLGNIVFLSALVSFLYYIGILGFVVKWIGKAVARFWAMRYAKAQNAPIVRIIWKARCAVMTISMLSL